MTELVSVASLCIRIAALAQLPIAFEMVLAGALRSRRYPYSHDSVHNRNLVNKDTRYLAYHRCMETGSDRYLVVVCSRLGFAQPGGSCNVPAWALGFSGTCPIIQ